MRFACIPFDGQAVAAVVLTVVLCFSHATSAQPAPDDLARVELLQNTLADVAEQVRPSVVAIRADRMISSGGGTTLPDDEVHRRLRERLIPAVGSGVIISSDGLILTNEHVVHNAEPSAIECTLATGERYTVRGMTTDPRSDLAVLRIDAEDLTPARLSDLSRVKQGHFAIVMGNPFGSASESQGRPAMSFGIISALGQNLTEKLDPDRYYGNLIQTDARINPGNSGGPLLNIHGEVIGVITAISSRSGGSEGVGYAIAIDERTKKTIEKLAGGEEVEYGYLGVGLKEPSRSDLEATGAEIVGGALVDEVQSGTPAAKAGLEVRDIVVGFAGKAVRSVDDLIRHVGAAEVDEPAQIVVYREKQRLKLSVTPMRREDVLRGVNLEVPLNWRGMRLENPTDELRSRFNLSEHVSGVVITHVEPGGPADQAGLSAGKVIREVGTERIRGVRRLRTMIPDLDGEVRIVPTGQPREEIMLPAS